MEDVDFTGSDLKWADFSVTTLTNVNFTNADLRYANFGGAILSNCTMTGAKVYRTNWTDADYGNELLINADIGRYPDDIDIPQDIPQGRPQGNTFQVHNAFFKINMDNYTEILNKIIIDDDDKIASYNRNIFEYIKQELSNKIDEIFPNEEVSKIKKEGLDRVFTQLEGIDIRDSNIYYNDKLIISNVVRGQCSD
jgi:uncharacterized protein YjbI with pentapeptide repeats